MQDQQPAQSSTKCDKCGSSIFRIGETRTDIIYQCFSRHTIYVQKQGQHIPVQGTKPPNDAA